ncbi:hypothetical protein Y032_0989g3304 [Ancylostoma ceylanicum]|uniref:Uncharacterized protein n=1 Tax=Ancylostoma ceylanicum TaxID=53326 RepID=A0A016W9Q8_9BILA|nr:hypothetical protein Y032_0989g3304 [Ancylostoma ceylanicum]
MRSILFLFLTLIPVALGLDCRKFSFAPACRGIMLKRSEAHEQGISQELLQIEQNLELLSSLLHHAEAEVDRCEKRNRRTNETTLQHAPCIIFCNKVKISLLVGINIILVCVLP